jgi:hypothetical protein
MTEPRGETEMTNWDQALEQFNDAIDKMHVADGGWPVPIAVSRKFVSPRTVSTIRPSDGSTPSPMT